MKQKVYNLIILDESGSMSVIAKEAVSGLNETFQTIQNAQMKYEDQEHYISFVTFNSERINTVMDCKKVDTEREIKWNDFAPNSCTPLYDAMGQSISKLRKVMKEEDVALVTIITDGMENASREFSGRAIKELVAILKTRGWVFAYIGTNQDVDAVADDMGIRSRMHYDYSGDGVMFAFKSVDACKKSFFDRLSKGASFLKEEDDYDLFAENSK